MKLQKRMGLAALAAQAMALGCLPAMSALAEGFYFGVSGGLASMDMPSKASIDQLFLDEGVAIESSSMDDEDTAWGLQVGYRWNSYVAAEVGYVNFGTAEYQAAPVGVDGEVSLRARSAGPTVSVLGMLPASKYFDFHLRAGVYFGDSRMRARAEDFVTGDVFSEEAKSSSEDLFAGIGAAWNINDSYSLRLEYQRFFDVGDKDHTGETDIDLLSFSLLFR
jgi:opacity protein-like surface antigen